MAPHSRLLIRTSFSLFSYAHCLVNVGCLTCVAIIDDYVLVPASHGPDAKSFGADVAPEPLLPNFGNGNNRMYQQDLNMWLIHNAKERTLDESIALGYVIGLRFFMICSPIVLGP